MLNKSMFMKCEICKRGMFDDPNLKLQATNKTNVYMCNFCLEATAAENEKIDTVAAPEMVGFPPLKPFPRKPIDYKNEHENIRKSLWVATYTTVLAATTHSPFNATPADDADTALKAFDQRFPEFKD